MRVTGLTVRLGLIVGAFLWAALWATDATAQQPSSVCGQDATVYYLNGIFYTEEDAYYDAVQLRNAVYPSLTPAEQRSTGFSNIYNSTQPFTDLLEVLAQSVGLEAARFWRALSGIDPLPDFIQDWLRDAAAETVWLANSLDLDTLNRVLTQSRNTLLEGKKVIIVAHSQGNLYANSAGFLLSPTELRSWTTVNLAVPDSQVPYSRTGYITLVNDLVIHPISDIGRAAVQLGPSLPANLDDGYPPSTDRLLNHQFDAAYLQGNPSRSAMINSIKSSLDATTVPAAGAEQGPFTVTLRWFAAGDVDLHVFEPTGVHVFYQNQRGLAGFLDVDNTIGFGPEHYFTSCTNVLPGEYLVGVNYFYGLGPQTAEVNVQAGSTTRSFTLRLETARSASGNLSPIPPLWSTSCRIRPPGRLLPTSRGRDPVGITRGSSAEVRATLKLA